MAAIHISEAEAAPDFACLIAQVRSGAEIVIENASARLPYSACLCRSAPPFQAFDRNHTSMKQADGSYRIPDIVTVQPGEPRQVAKAMRAINESSGEIKWRASEGCLQSVKHAEALFTSGVYIGADGAKVLSAFEGAKAA